MSMWFFMLIFAIVLIYFIMTKVSKKRSPQVHSIYQIIYASTAKDASLDELNNILSSSAKKNKQNNIRGALMYYEGFFLQCIAGEKEVIEQTFAKIKDDARHEKIHIISQGPILDNIFDAWSMSYVSGIAYIQIIEEIVKTTRFDPYNLDEQTALKILQEVSMRI